MEICFYEILMALVKLSGVFTSYRGLWAGQYQSPVTYTDACSCFQPGLEWKASHSQPESAMIGILTVVTLAPYWDIQLSLVFHNI